MPDRDGVYWHWDGNLKVRIADRYPRRSHSRCVHLLLCRYDLTTSVTVRTCISTALLQSSFTDIVDGHSRMSRYVRPDRTRKPTSTPMSVRTQNPNTPMIYKWRIGNFGDFELKVPSGRKIWLLIFQIVRFIGEFRFSIRILLYFIALTHCR